MSKKVEAGNNLFLQQNGISTDTDAKKGPILRLQDSWNIDIDEESLKADGLKFDFDQKTFIALQKSTMRGLKWYIADFCTSLYCLEREKVYKIPRLFEWRSVNVYL